MSLSTQQIASTLPRLRGLIEEWESKNATLPTSPDKLGSTTSSDQTSSTRSKRDVIITFRTRPMLPEEGSRFVPAEVASSNSEDTDPDAYLCEAISVRSMEPGITVAHVPSMKVL